MCTQLILKKGKQKPKVGSQIYAWVPTYQKKEKKNHAWGPNFFLFFPFYDTFFANKQQAET